MAKPDSKVLLHILLSLSDSFASSISSGHPILWVTLRRRLFKLSIRYIIFGSNTYFKSKIWSREFTMKTTPGVLLPKWKILTSVGHSQRRFQISNSFRVETHGDTGWRGVATVFQVRSSLWTCVFVGLSDLFECIEIYNTSRENCKEKLGY